jgi:hypothetical protein
LAEDLAHVSLLLSIQATLDCRYLTLVGTLRAMAGHTGRAWGDSSDRRVKALPMCDWTIRRPPQVEPNPTIKVLTRHSAQVHRL